MSKILSFKLIALIVLTSAAVSCQKTSNQSVELTEEEKRLPQNALVGFDIADGLEATLFAYEPLLVNPTNIDIDAKGRIWVCEGYNYRPRLNPGNPVDDEGDRIVILEDTDGDGKADSRKIFYQGNDVNSALGIAVLGNKVIVSRSPNVLVFTDDNGDDIPDNKEVLFSNIEGEQHDHAVHAFVFGPDGKLYFNMGNAGMQLSDKDGKIIKDVTGKNIVDDGKPYREGMIFRTDFSGSSVEVMADNFRNPYEVTIDSYGNLWQSDNDDDGNKGVRINFILPYGNYGYRDEITGGNWRTRRTGMHEEIPLRHWHQNDPGVVPNLLQTGGGSPTGIVFYEGSLLPEPFQNTLIHTDAGPNVVRAYPTKKSGSGYTAEIVNIMKANSDQWFRPSDVCVAPDGSIFVADWYDPGVGGHQMGDLQQGRIYRIAPTGHTYKVSSPTMETPTQAIAALKSPNMATRYQAWEKLNQWGLEAEQALNELYKSDNSHFQARALWLLAQIDGKVSNYIKSGLSQPNEDLRITALKIAQLYDTENLPEYIESVIDDPSVQVQREAITSLMKVEVSQATKLWTKLTEKYPVGDRWYLEALGIISDRKPTEFFAAWKSSIGENWKTTAGKDLIWRFRAPATIPLIAEIIQDPATSQQEMNLFFRTLDFQDVPEKHKMLISLLNGNVPLQKEINQLVITHVSTSAMDSSPKLKKALYQALEEVKGTEQYLEWVSKFELTDQSAELEDLYLKDPNGNIGVASARILYEMKGLKYFSNQLQSKNQIVVNNTIMVLTNMGGDDTWDLLKSVALNDNAEMIVRKKAIKAMGKGWRAENKLLESLKNNELPEPLVDIAATTLLSAIKSKVREEAAKYLPIEEGEELPPIQDLVALDGSSENGFIVFEKYCQSCHQVNDSGINFGPNLSEIGNKLSKEGLYGAILYPDAGINFGFEGFVIETKSGETAVGYISSNTEDVIELTKIGGIKTIYKKDDIISMNELENSLMTSGLHKIMSKEEVVDLVAYLSILGKQEVL